VADTRICEQCGAVFVPRREHARFCAVPCRAAWNREHMGDPAAEASALQWSITAMSEITRRLPQVKVWDRARAWALIGDAVWWITIVDATLVRHHPGAYDGVADGQAPAERRRTEGTLAGLRFVRNRIGRKVSLAEFAGPGMPDPGPDARITGWTWRPVPEPELAWLPPRAQAWEMARYRAYQTQLAGHTIGETFGRSAAFLGLAATNATGISEALSLRPAPVNRGSPARRMAEGLHLAEPLVDAEYVALAPEDVLGGVAAQVAEERGRERRGRR
jgi:hypothetical protein